MQAVDYVISNLYPAIPIPYPDYSYTQMAMNDFLSCNMGPIATAQLPSRVKTKKSLTVPGEKLLLLVNREKYTPR